MSGPANLAHIQKHQSWLREREFDRAAESMASLDARMERIFAEFREWCARYDRGEAPPVEMAPKTRSEMQGEAAALQAAQDAEKRESRRIPESMKKHRGVHGYNVPEGDYYPPRPTPPPAPPLPLRAISMTTSAQSAPESAAKAAQIRAEINE